MAIGFTALSRKPIGNEAEVVGEVTGDTSYTTGGYAYTAVTFGLATINYLLLVEVNAGGVNVEHDRTNKKFLIKDFNYPGVAEGAAVEVANLSNQSGVKWTILARGKTTKSFTK